MSEQRRNHRTPGWRLFARRWLATVVCSLAIVTFVFGLGGFTWQYAASTAIQAITTPATSAKPPPNQDWSIPLFKTVQLYLLNSGAEDDTDHPSNWFLIIARLSAAALFLLLSSTVILSILDNVRRLPSQLTRRNHIVICGLGQIGLQLLDDIKEAHDAYAMLNNEQRKELKNPNPPTRPENVIVVESNPTNPWIDRARSLGATIVIGDSTKADTHFEARTLHAREVFVVNGDDGINLEVAAELGNLFVLEKVDRSTVPLKLYVHIVDTNFATTLRPYCTILHDTPNMLVQVFNVPRTAAVRLVTNQLWPYAPKDSNETAHFVILGFGAMGQALAVQLAQLGSFPNRKRSRFTIADPDIEKHAATFMSRFPRFTSWTDYENIGVKEFSAAADAWGSNEHPLPEHLKVSSPDAIQYACNAEFIDLDAGRSDDLLAIKLTKQFAEQGVKPFVFICGQQDRDNFETAVQLRDQLACYGQFDVPIFVWLPRQPALAETLARATNSKFYPFGECRSAASYQDITTPLREIVGIKIQADYENTALANANKADKKYTKKSWSELRDDYRESNRVAADHMLIKLQYVGVEIVRKTKPDQKSGRFTKDFTEKTRQVLAEMEHYRWVAERLLAGWRYCPMGSTEDEINAYKKLKFNHNITVFEKSEAKKDFDQINVIYEECQKLDGFVLKKLDRGDSSRQGKA